MTEQNTAVPASIQPFVQPLLDLVLTFSRMLQMAEAKGLPMTLGAYCLDANCGAYSLTARIVLNDEFDRGDEDSVLIYSNSKDVAIKVQWQSKATGWQVYRRYTWNSGGPPDALVDIFGLHREYEVKSDNGGWDIVERVLTCAAAEQKKARPAT